MARVKETARRGGFSRRSRCGYKRSQPSPNYNYLSPQLKRARISRSTNTMQMLKYKRSLASMKRINDSIKEFNVGLAMDLQNHHKIRNQVKQVIICQYPYSFD